MRKKVIVVVADFCSYKEITDGLQNSCKEALSDYDCEEERVGGALELPPALLFLAKKKPYCMVALGCVLRGETYHFEIVANTSANGIMQVQLQTGIAVGNGVLTVENKAQAMARADKGAAAAMAALDLARILHGDSGEPARI